MSASLLSKRYINDIIIQLTGKGELLMGDANTANTKKKTDEIKQAFLSSAISDISAYIQLADTKVSIIMAATVALIVGLFA